MKKNKNAILFRFFLLAAVCQLWSQKQPNVIYILSDDLGYGEVGIMVRK